MRNSNLSVFVRAVTCFVVVVVSVFVIVPASLALETTANPFSDLSSAHPNYDAVISLYEWGTINGYPDGTFKPDNEINRAEFLKILVGSGDEGLAYADELESSQSGCFTDVGEEWFAAYVCAGKSSTIITKPYDDVPLDAWYTPYVVRAKELGILEETGANLNPGANMSRAGICEMMYRSEFTVTPEPGFIPDSESATVTRVVDGDTLEVDLDGVTEKVRLLGIDTPEFSSKDCYAQEATDYIEGLDLVQEVTLTIDVLNDDRDRYDRLLRYVELDGLDINKKMIRDGYALYYDTYDVLRGAEYAEAELLAQSEVLGLWGDCQGAGE